MVDHDDRCPFLVPVMADQLWMYPLPAYCHRPDAPVKVPALETFFRVCLSPEHARCPGFRTTVTRQGRLADQAQGIPRSRGTGEGVERRLS